MTFSKGDIWHPPYAEFIGVYRYEQGHVDAAPADDIHGRAPDYRDIVPENTPFFAIVRERDGFSDTPNAQQLADSIRGHGYDAEIVQRRPVDVEQVSESEFFEQAAELVEEEGYSEEEADQIVSERIGYDPHMTEHTSLVFYWPSP